MRAPCRATDEDHLLLARRYALATAMPDAVVAARVLESVESLFPHSAELGNQCEPALVADIVRDVRLQQPPVAYTRELVAQVRAVGRHDVYGDGMSAREAFLMAIADLSDVALTDYRRGASEPGPPPGKAFVRMLALGYLARSPNIGPAASRWLDAGAPAAGPTSDRDRELVLLHKTVRHYLARHPTAIPAWRDVTTTALAHPGDLGPVLARLDALAGVKDLAIADRIVAARGRFPLTEGVPGAAHDLLRAAVAARLDATTRQLGYVSPLVPLRAAFDPWRDWLDREPAAGSVSVGAAAEQLGMLDQELARATRTETRCRVLAQLPAWVAATDADARFDALMAPVFDGDQLQPSTENWCRIGTALAIDDVALDRRAHALLRLLTFTDAAAYDTRGDAPEPGEFLSREPAIARALAAHALGSHPAWVTDDLHPVLLALAVTPLGGPHMTDEPAARLQPAFEHLLAGPEGERLARAWLADLPHLARRGDVTSTPPSDAAIARVLALAEAAPRLGLATEARAVFEDIAATPVPGPEQAAMHPLLVRAAKIALATMEPAITSPRPTP